MRSREVKETLAEAESSVRLDPRDSTAHYRLGLALNERHGPQAALASLRRAAEIAPRSLECRYALGICLKNLGRYRDAAIHLRGAVSCDPTNVSCLYHLGIVLFRLERMLDARECFRRVVELDPAHAEATADLALTFEWSQDYRQAIALTELALALDGGLARAHNNLGKLFLRMGRFDEAKAACQTALDRGEPNAIFNLGVLDLYEGNSNAAIGKFRETLIRHPSFVGAYCNISRIKRYQDPNDPDLHAMQKLLEEELPDSERAALEMSLGKAHDDLGQVDEAFGHVCSGNTIRRRLNTYNPAETESTVDRLIGTFDSSYFRSLDESSGINDCLPVLIVGMPRSGTTLVEQIIASHPVAAGAGEMKELAHICTEVLRLSNSSDLIEAIVQLEPGKGRRLAEGYLNRMRGLHPRAERVTDKMPLNFLRLGLAAQLFPLAKVIHCKRNAMDVCWSCYFHDFTESLPFTYGLTDVGHYYRQYERLMEHWRTSLPLAILDVEYESLVADHEGTSRQIIEFCELDWSAACLEFHKTRRTIDSMSNLQVREPVYYSSIGRWRRYERYLDTLKDQLSSFNAIGAPLAHLGR